MTAIPGDLIQRQPDGSYLVYPLSAAGGYGGPLVGNYTGYTDDLAVAQAIALAAPEGTVILAPGTFDFASPVSTPTQSTGFLTIRGSGQDVTTIRATSSYTSIDNVLNLAMPGEITDLTVDGSSVAQNVGGANFTLAADISAMAFRRVTFTGVNPSAPSNGWNLIIWNQNASYVIDTLTLEDVTVSGPSATSYDAMAVNSFTTCYVSRMSLLNLARTPNFYQGGTLIIDGLYSNGCGTVGSLIIDAGVARATVSGLVVEPRDSSNFAPVVVNCPVLLADGWHLDSVSGFAVTASIGATGGSNGGTWKFADSVIKGGVKFALTGELELSNVDLQGVEGFGIEDSNAAASVSTVIWSGGAYDGTSGFTYPWLKSVNGTTWKGTIRDVVLANLPASPISGTITWIGRTGIFNCPGYNPVGAFASQPTVPVSGTAYTNNLGTDATVFVTGGTVTGIAIGGTATGLTSGAFRVPAGQTITLTYSAAPTWTWFGD